MKRLRFFIVFGLVVILITGCNPCKRLIRRCPPHDSTTVVQTIVHDSIWIKIPGDSILVSVPMVDLRDLGLVVETSDQKVTAQVKHDTLFLEAKCKDDSLMAVINHLETKINNTKTIIKEVKVDVPVKHIPKIAWICIIIVIVELLVAGILAYFRIRAGGIQSVLKRLKPQ